MNNYYLYDNQDNIDNIDNEYHLKKKYIIIYSLSILIAFVSGGLINHYSGNTLNYCNCSLI